MKIRSVNPFTGQLNKELEAFTNEDTDREIEKSRATFRIWRGVPVVKRAESLKKLAGTLRARKREYAELITREMGKPIRDSLGEIEKCAWLCEYYSDNAAFFLAPEVIRTEALRSYVVFQPLGIVLAIMPWNFPFWQAFRFAVPATVAGNVVLLKHAANVPLCALAIEGVFRESGFPENILKTLLIDENEALRIIDEDRVDAVSLTGSNYAGEQVGAIAGKRIKKVVLELGGSDPFIVLEDADIEKAARAGARSRLINCGQSCISAKRFIVMESIAGEFRKHFIDQLRNVIIGDPMEEKTDIGPIARQKIFDGLKEQLRDAKEKGAEVIELANPFPGSLFFAPAVVLYPKNDMKVLSEEVFGPIAPVITVSNDDEAVETANATPYGLGASVWSRDLERAERLAERIESGIVAINDFVKSDPRLPFGGVKKSGIGRELSHYGLKEFVNIKSLVVNEG